MFGFGSFAELPFATIPDLVAPQEILLGGHFGFDERDKKWEKDKKEEQKRRERLHNAMFGLPPQEREQITSSPTTTINVASQSVLDYDKLLTQIRTISARIEIERDEDDLMDILELI